MKYILLCLLPVILCAPDKRFLFDGTLFDTRTLKCDVQIMIDNLGVEPTEEACEGECHNLLQEGHVLNFGCPLVCHGLQSLAHSWHLVPEEGEGDPCAPLTTKQPIPVAEG